MNALHANHLASSSSHYFSVCSWPDFFWSAFFCTNLQQPGFSLGLFALGLPESTCGGEATLWCVLPGAALPRRSCARQTPSDSPSDRQIDEGGEAPLRSAPTAPPEPESLPRQHGLRRNLC